MELIEKQRPQDDQAGQATIDVLSKHIAVLDESGVILTVNKAWREFAFANSGNPDLVSEGANYLDVCDRAAARGDTDAAMAASLIRAVAAGQREMAAMEYSCDAPGEQRWFKMRVTRAARNGQLRLVVRHENITERKRAENQVKFQSHLLASVEQAVIATDLDGIITYWNPFAERLYGWTAAEAIGQNFADIVPSDAIREQMMQMMVRLEAGHSCSGEFQVRHRDGTSFPVHITDSPIRDEHGKLIGIIGISTDISERKKFERELQLAAMVYQAIGEAIVVVNTDNKVVAFNPAFTQLIGYGEPELVGKSIRLFCSNRNYPGFHDEVRHSLDRTGRWQGKVWTRRKNGEEFLEWLMIDTIFDESGRPRHRIGMLSAMTDQKLAEETIWRQANFDPLTGLPNRSLFQERLEHEVMKAARTHRSLSLMFIDLDHFKEVNDTLGHDTGDILLKEAALRLSHCIRQVDTVARLGGDEFTIILGELEDCDSVERVAQDILRRLAEPFQVDMEFIYLSASIGVTLYPADADNVAALQKNADQAMYAAKQNGRNRFQYFTPSMQLAAQARMRTANDLRNALAENQLQVLYQPIVELATGRVHKVEALVRWQHPVRGLVNPHDFIPIAEETGMIVGIGEWVFQEAMYQAARWRETIDPQFQISVNMSPVQFHNQSINHKEWFGRLHTQDRSPNMAGEIVVEITEGLLLEASTSVQELLLRFRDAGVQVAIDDFGTGYSSLSYLRKFDIDYLKIDQSFVLKMKAGSDDLALCEAIVMMGHKLGIKVIAEGVETEEQRDLLTAAGCDYGQGFLFATPTPADTLDALLKTDHFSLR